MTVCLIARFKELRDAVPRSGSTIARTDYGQSQALCFFLISNFWFTFQVM